MEMVMRGEIDPPPKQINAARVLIEYAEPKLSALAVSQIPANDFAAALERAIKRANPRRQRRYSCLPSSPLMKEANGAVETQSALIERLIAN